MIRMNNELTFDYKNYSKDSVKLFLDSLHLIEPNPTDIVQEWYCQQLKDHTCLYS